MAWLSVSVPVMLLHAEKDPSIEWLAYSGDPARRGRRARRRLDQGSATTTTDCPLLRA